jgi:hypothetical protein
MFEIRKPRAVAQGRRKPTREWEEYFRLVQQGVSGVAGQGIGENFALYRMDTALRLRAPRHGCSAFAAAVRFPGCGLA